MAVEINNISNRAIQQSAEQVKNSSQRNSAAVSGSSTTAQADKVSLTSSASQLQALESQISSLPVVDAERVEAVQRAVATGNHVIDPPTIAENLLTQEVSLAQKG